MKLTNVISRVATASPREIRVRARQALLSGMNRVLADRGRSLYPREGHLRSLGLGSRSLTDFIQDRGCRWFIDEQRRRQLKDHFVARPAAAAELIERADCILRDRMYVLGHGAVPFEGHGRWHRDHILGIDAEPEFHARIKYLDPTEVGDSKHIWEPSRFAWGYWQGAAFLLTESREYAELYSSLAIDWFHNNPYPLGIAYCSALEIALRAYAWVWALDLFRNALVCEEVVDRLVNGIWVGCRHIENNLSYYFAPNTHLLGEAFALFACGAALPEFKEAARWRTLGATILAQEAIRQFHADGTHRELSTGYHLYATDFYIQAMLIARKTGHELPPVVEECAYRAVQRLADLSTNDGVVPRLNDCDDGRLDWFATDPIDASPSLLAARSLWPGLDLPCLAEGKNGYHLWMADDSQAMALAQTSVVACSDGISPSVSGRVSAIDAFDSGLVTHRNACKDFLLFRCGPFGYLDCGHSHDGQTSVNLYLHGHPVIVDSGTGAYTQSQATRNRFRNAYGKNVVMLEGRGPSSPDGWFLWGRKTHATLTRARRKQGGFECSGYHNGFEAALGFRAHISRQVHFDDRGTLFVVDRWDAAAPVNATLAWTLHPSWQPELVRHDAMNQPSHWTGTLRHNDGNISYFLACQFTADIQVHAMDNGLPDPADDEDNSLRGGELPENDTCKFTASVVEGPYSPGYGVMQQTPYIVMEFPKARAGSVVTVFSRGNALSLQKSRAAQIQLMSGSECLASIAGPIAESV